MIKFDIKRFKNKVISMFGGQKNLYLFGVTLFIFMMIPLSVSLALHKQNLATEAARGSGGGGGGGGGGRTNPGFVHASGKNVLSGSNKVIYLRGFQGLKFYPIDKDIYFMATEQKGIDPAQVDLFATDLNSYTITDYDVQEIKSTGANTVRLWLYLHEVQHSPYQYSTEALTLLENTINKFGSNGIYVIPVLAGLGQNSYPDEVYFKNRGVDLWNASTDTKNQTIALWKVLAAKFKDNQYIAGYDVVNEPEPPSAQALHDFYTELISAIRQVDTNHIIILPLAEKHEQDYQLGGSYSDANIMATFHYYYPVQYTLDTLYAQNPDLTYPGQIGNTYWDKAMHQQIFDAALALPEIQNMPIYVGEFGAHGMRDNNGGLTWVDDVMSIMNASNLNYTMHNYKHANFYGYWIMKPEVKQAINDILTGFANGTILPSDITVEQKQMLETQNGYYQRTGIKPVISSYFGAGSGSKTR